MGRMLWKNSENDLLSKCQFRTPNATQADSCQDEASASRYAAEASVWQENVDYFRNSRFGWGIAAGRPGDCPNARSAPRPLSSAPSPAVRPRR